MCEGPFVFCGGHVELSALSTMMLLDLQNHGMNCGKHIIVAIFEDFRAFYFLPSRFAVGVRVPG